MILVIYRILYGTDFLERSVRSVYNEADHVWIGYSTEPWSKPKGFPDIRDIEESPIKTIEDNFNLTEGKITLFYHHVDTPRGQFNYLYDQATYEKGIPTIVVFMEPDMVWAPGMFKTFMEQVKSSDKTIITAPQIELWKTNEWRIPQRKRFGPTAYKIVPPPLGFGQFPLDGRYPVVSTGGCFNFGFCFNERTMLYKHQSALDFSAKIGDSVPSPTWYNEKWLNWTPEVTNLEPSAKHTQLIPHALPYQMPEDMRKFMNENPSKNT